MYDDDDDDDDDDDGDGDGDGDDDQQQLLYYMHTFQWGEQVKKNLEQIEEVNFKPSCCQWSQIAQWNNDEPNLVAINGFLTASPA